MRKTSAEYSDYDLLNAAAHDFFLDMSPHAAQLLEAIRALAWDVEVALIAPDDRTIAFFPHDPERDSNFASRFGLQIAPAQPGWHLLYCNLGEAD